MRYEMHDLDGTGSRRTAVHDLPPAPEHPDFPGLRDYWAAVTDVPCPATGCTGTVRWAEAGYAPGYRICDGCGRHFMADGTAEAPTLLRVRDRRSNVTAEDDRHG